MSRKIKLPSNLLILIPLLFSPLIATSATAPLKVGISEIPPCVLHATGTPSGFSIDLWDAVASQMNQQYSLHASDFATKLAKTESAELDLAIGCISLTSDREQRMDFSLPIAGGGFQSVTLVRSGVLPHFSDASKRMLLLLSGLIICFSHLMWWSERGQNAFSDRYFPGIFEAVWFSVVTMSTVGYGDIAPKKWLGKFSAMLIILTGVTTFGVVFSQFATDALQTRAQFSIDSINDLRSARVATKAATSTEQYLSKNGIQANLYNNIEEALTALREKAVDIVVYDAPAMAFAVQQSSDLIATGQRLNPHHYAIALPQESQLTEEINRALLHVIENGQYQAIRNRWF